MKNILHLFKRDVQNVSRSVIGMVVVMGLIIVHVSMHGLTSPEAGIPTAIPATLRLQWSTPMRVTRAI